MKNSGYMKHEARGRQQICESLCIANVMVCATEMLTVKA